MGVCAFGGGAKGASLSCEGAQYRGVTGSGQLAQQQGMLQDRLEIEPGCAMRRIADRGPLDLPHGCVGEYARVPMHTEPLVEGTHRVRQSTHTYRTAC